MTVSRKDQLSIPTLGVGFLKQGPQGERASHYLLEAAKGKKTWDPNQLCNVVASNLEDYGGPVLFEIEPQQAR
jgi:hypothetical protein